MSSWATRAIEDLREGKTTQVKPHGNSMRPKVMSGALVTLEPRDTYEVGDIVLARVKGTLYLHLVKAVQGGRYQIGNNRGGINGWTRTVYGKAVRVENP